MCTRCAFSAWLRRGEREGRAGCAIARGYRRNWCNKYKNFRGCRDGRLVKIIETRHYLSGRYFLLIPSITFYTNPTRGVCAWLYNPEPLEETTRSRTGAGVMSRESAVVGSAATPPFGGLSPNGDNSNPSLHHFLTLKLETKGAAREGYI